MADQRTDVRDLPLICAIGESDFELHGTKDNFALWSESAEKCVTFTDLDGLDIAQRILRDACAKRPFEGAKLAEWTEANGQ